MRASWKAETPVWENGLAQRSLHRTWDVGRDEVRCVWGVCVEIWVWRTSLRSSREAKREKAVARQKVAVRIGHGLSPVGLPSCRAKSGGCPGRWLHFPSHPSALLELGDIQRERGNSCEETFPGLL